MLVWLVPVALFWGLAAIYLGGAPIHIRGGGGWRQIGGLLLGFAAYLGVYAALRILTLGVFGPILGGVVVPLIVTSMFLPFLVKLTFRLVGVHITRAEAEA